MKLPALCVEHSGADPVWHGWPTVEFAREIKARTMTDERGLRFYRKTIWDGWQRLKTQNDFACLNHFLGIYR